MDIAFLMLRLDYYGLFLSRCFCPSQEDVACAKKNRSLLEGAYREWRFTWRVEGQLMDKRGKRKASFPLGGHPKPLDGCPKKSTVNIWDPYREPVAYIDIHCYLSSGCPDSVRMWWQESARRQLPILYLKTNQKESSFMRSWLSQHTSLLYNII